MFEGHLGKIGFGAVVVAVVNSDPRAVAVLGLVDGKLHGPQADELTHTVVAVHNRGGSCLAGDADIRARVKDACLQTSHIDGKPDHAVGMNAAKFGLDQAVGNDSGLHGRKVESLQDLYAETVEIGFGYRERTFISVGHL